MENHPAYRGEIEYKNYQASVWEFQPGNFNAGVSKENITVNVQSASLDELSNNFRVAVDEFQQTVVRNGSEVVYGMEMGGASRVFLTLEEYQEKNPGTKHEIWKISENGQYYWQAGTMYANSAGDICTTTATKATLHLRGEQYFLCYK